MPHPALAGLPEGSRRKRGPRARAAVAAGSRAAAAPCPLLQRDPDVPDRRRSAWLPLAFPPPRPAARPSDSERRDVPVGLEAAGGAAAGAGRGAAEALIRSGAAGRQGSIQRADKGRVCGAEPAGTERSAGGPRGAPCPPRQRRAAPRPERRLTRPRSTRGPHGRGEPRPAGAERGPPAAQVTSRPPRQTSAFPLQQRP